MRVGYARVSTSDQNPELQLEALRRAGCEKVFTEKASGARDDRPELKRILGDVLRVGDTLVVWKLDRLARSLKKLIATAEELERSQVGFPSVATGTSIRTGKLAEGALQVTSRMNDGGLIFADGMEQDFLGSYWGRRVSVAPAADALHLVVAGR